MGFLFPHSPVYADLSYKFAFELFRLVKFAFFFFFFFLTARVVFHFSLFVRVSFALPVF